MKKVVVSGAFDDIRSCDLRFLEEASKLGDVTVLLWTDSLVEKHSGKPPKFPLAERNYFLNAVRWVNRVVDIASDENSLLKNLHADVWADYEPTKNFAREKFCRDHKLTYHVFSANELKGFPASPPLPSSSGRKKVIATGCYDWLHSGHVRFFEEVSAYGDLYVVVGHDANIRLLKGEGHPLLRQEERRYLTGCIRYVTQSLISSGEG